MSVNSKTPMALYKANLELVLRMGTLLQENRQRWMKAGAAGASAAIERTLAETERMLTTNDWDSLSKMPGEAFWNSLRGEPGPLQDSVESAMRSQTEFSEGLRQAFAEWQQQSNEALGGIAAQPAPWVLSDMMQAFNAATSGVAAASGNRPSEPASPATKANAQARPSKPRADKPDGSNKAPSARKQPGKAKARKPARQ